MYIEMIVGFTSDKDVAIVTVVDSGGILRRMPIRYSSGIERAMIFVRNDKLHALLIDEASLSSSKVVMVSGDLGDNIELNYLKMINYNTYIYLSPGSDEWCYLRIKFAGDEYSVEGVPDGVGFMHYDGERYWRWDVGPLSTIKYISSDPTYSFEMQDKFGYMKDARNGLVLTRTFEAGAEGRYALYILCPRTRDVIWSYASAIGERMYYMHAEFAADGVIFMTISSHFVLPVYIFINITDNTAYKLTFCGLVGSNKKLFENYLV